MIVRLYLPLPAFGTTLSDQWIHLVARRWADSRMSKVEGQRASLFVVRVRALYRVRGGRAYVMCLESGVDTGDDRRVMLMVEV